MEKERTNEKIFDRPLFLWGVGIILSFLLFLTQTSEKLLETFKSFEGLVFFGVIFLWFLSCFLPFRSKLLRVLSAFCRVIVKRSSCFWNVVRSLCDNFYCLSKGSFEPLLRDAFFSQTIPGFRASLRYKGVEFAFRYCPRGRFVMGSPVEENQNMQAANENQRSVTIPKGFWFGETPITNEQWKVVKRRKQRRVKLGEPQHPVVFVTLDDCRNFVDSLNKRNLAPKGFQFDLPTEEQWEYACRAGTTGANYGIPLNDCAWYRKNSDFKIHKVGLKEPNNWGIYDALGNVGEWTNTEYTNAEGNQPGSYVVRGGFFSLDEEHTRPANRILRFPENPDSPSDGYDNIGVRIVLVRKES